MNGKTETEQKFVMKRNIMIIDGLNILKHPKGENNLRNIDHVRNWAKDNGVSPVFILPGFRKFKALNKHDDFILLDPRIYDDIAILAYAREYDSAILSNDKFREFRKMFKDLDFERIFPYRIKNGNLITQASDFFFFKNTNSIKQHNSKQVIGAVN